MPNASGETCAATFGRQLSLLKLPERVAGGILPPAISHPETCLGKTNERIEVDMTNYRNKQTYYGAVDYHTGEFLVKAYPQGNCDLKIEFQQYLQAQSPEQRLVVVWVVLNRKG